MNNLTLVGGHVLLPHQADWSTTPKVSRMWRSPVDISRSGKENRTTARPKPWLLLAYSVLPFDQVEKARLEDRLTRSLLAGKAAVPLWGRGVVTGEDCSPGDLSLTMSRADHGFTPGSYLFVQPDEPAAYDTWDTLLVSQSSPSGVEEVDLVAGPANGYPAGTRVWPLLFGRPVPSQFGALNSARARHLVSVQFDGRAVSAFAYDDFTDYPVGSFTGPLDGGTGFDGPWVFGAVQ